MKHSTQLVTLSAQRLAYGSMPLELAESRPRSNFPESRNSFSKVRSAKLNTDVTILMPGTDYFGENALKKKTSHSCQHHAEITHFRCTGSSLHSNQGRGRKLMNFSCMHHPTKNDVTSGLNCDSRFIAQSEKMAFRLLKIPLYL